MHKIYKIMEKNPQDIGYQILQEVVFAGTDKESSRHISTLLAAGKIKRIAPKVYTSNLQDDASAVIRRNLFRVLGRLFPQAVLSHRTAFEYSPTTDGDIFLTYSYSRKVELPGVTVHLIEGPQGEAEDTPFIEGLYVSQQARAFLENMQPSNKGKGAVKCLSQQEIENKLEQIIRVNGEEAINQLREHAREVSSRLNMTSEFTQLNRLISAILNTHTTKILTSPIAIARAMGEPYDAHRLEMFHKLFIYLNNETFADCKEQNSTTEQFRTFAFFESYFSNYIEGTEFTVKDAQQIIDTNQPLVARYDDSHDILGTFYLVSNRAEMIRLPQSGDELIQMLQARHRVLLSAREAKHPGLFKMENNHAGETFFVDFNLVRGTLKQGFQFYQALQNPFARAVMMHFLVSEVHPFNDGNGRTARVMMNAELSAANQCKIIIPNVYRDNYILSLKKLSRQGDASVFVQVLQRLQQYAATIPCTSFDEANNYLLRTHAYMDPDEGQLIE